MPIVLGGPWPGRNIEKHWVTTLDGDYDTARGCGCDAGVRMRDGVVQLKRRATGEWVTPPKINKNIAEGAKFLVLAPKGWTPMPDAMPEGCFVQTPEGVERRCDTCVFGGHANSMSRKCDSMSGDGQCWGRAGESMAYGNWCPKVDEK